MRRIIALPTLLSFLAPLASAQDPAPTPRDLSAADYGRFEQLRSGSLSPDGRWIHWTVDRVRGKDTLHLRELGGDGHWTFDEASGASFSDDSAWIGFRVGPSEEQRDELREKKKPIRQALHLLRLGDAEPEKIEDIASFAFSGDGRFVAMRRAVPDAKRSEDAESAEDAIGGDLIVRDLTSGRDTTFGNVGAYAWSDQAALLCLAIEARDRVGNGVQLFDASSGTLRTLDSANAGYRALTWREDAGDLAALQVNEHGDDEDDTVQVLAWRDVAGEFPQHFRFDHREAERFPDDQRVVESGGVRWSDDGRALFFGIRSWDDRPKEEGADGQQGGDEPESDDAAVETDTADEVAETELEALRDSLKKPSNVEVWHHRDTDILPLQKKRATADERRSDLCALWLDDGSFVRLGDELTEEVRLLDGQRRALGLDNTPYETEKRFGPTRYDAYVIDTRTGVRQRFLEGVKFVSQASPEGRHLPYLREGALWSYDVESGLHRDLTGKLAADFVDDERNVLTDESPPYGAVQWTDDGAWLIAHSRWDVWVLSPDGSAARRLTNGREDSVRHRVIDLDRDMDWFDASGPWYVSVYGDLTKRSGFARWSADGGIERLVWKDAGVGGLQKAEDADVFIFTEQRFDDSPDLFVTGPSLAGPRQVTETNGFLSEFHWGRSELVDFESVNGEALQGALFYPANYQPGRQYPMVVYIYEQRSQVLHQFDVPTETSPYDTAVFTTQGYFVFQPDIVYRAQNPGLSAQECVVPAVEKVLATGMIDSARVALMGHSWGAYQTAFLCTHTDVFAAGVAGAPLTNMISMSMSIYWNSGQTDTWIFHESQGRMDQPFWEDLETYVANSPIFGVPRMKTPLLVAFGDEDGAVDWNQGVEFYNAARLAQKPVVMLVYPGENHGLRRKENQVDYHWRVREWFDHYVKDQQAPSWITDGLKWLDRKREIELFERQRKADKGGSDRSDR